MDLFTGDYHIHAWQIYASLGLILAVSEIFIPGFIVLPIGIALGLTSLASVFISDLVMQMTVLAVCLIVVFFVIKKVLGLKLIVSTSKSNVDDMIGKEVRVFKTITSSDSGSIKLYADEWTAVLESGEAAVGEKVRIVKIEGNKLFVEKL